MKKKFVILLIGLIVACVVVLAIAVSSNTNKVKYYTASVIVDEFGNITVEETVVIDYKSYDNYLYRDIKFLKNHRSNPLFSDLDSSLYINDEASLDESSVVVEVYRGDIINELGLAKNITDEVEIGYSYNNDRDKYGNVIDCYPSSHSCESLYVDATNCGTLVGLMSFKYTYTINDMVTVYNDCAELNYRLFEYFAYPVKVAGVTIVLPSSNLDKDDFYCYGHGLSSGRVTKLENYQFDYYAKNIKEDQEFECRVVFPKEIVSGVDEKNIVKSDMLDKILSYEKKLADETNLRANVAIVMNIWTIVLGALMIFFTVKVYKKYDKEYAPAFDKEYLRELPFNYSPAEMSYLYYFGKTNDEDVTATLLDLIRRGFLELEYFGSVNDDDPKFVIKKNHDKFNKELNTLKHHEKQLIHWFINIIGNKNQVSIDEIDNYGKSYSEAQKFQTNAKEFIDNVKLECSSYDWFVNTTKSKAKAFAYALIPFGTIIIMGILNMLFAITFEWNLIFIGVILAAYIIYVLSIKKRSVNGNEEYAKWKAFKKFLEDFGNFEDYPMPGIVVWEEFLVYATSFKIADKVMNQLQVKLPDVDTVNNDSIYYGGTYMNTFYWRHRHNRFIISNSMNRALTSARRNTMSSIAAHNAKSSGSGRGGGFSGGSSFGGGGGGFRGGR